MAAPLLREEDVGREEGLSAAHEGCQVTTQGLEWLWPVVRRWGPQDTEGKGRFQGPWRLSALTCDGVLSSRQALTTQPHPEVSGRWQWGQGRGLCHCQMKGYWESHVFLAGDSLHQN